MTAAPGPVVVLAGPTATGKTAAAIELAQRLGGEIVGADSVQIYREFDIGSAKPSQAERRAVPHHLIDALDPDEFIDAMVYARRADEVIAAIQARGALPLIVGGTGLWLRALLRGLVDLPDPDFELRARLERQADAMGRDALYAWLEQVDPRAASQIHPNDRVRIIRALEVYEQTGVPLGEHQARHALGAPRYDALFIMVDVPKEQHEPRIQQRTRQMLESGWADEARTLLGRWGPDVRPFGSVGYRQLREHLLEDVPLEETERRIVKATRVYARRQRTWFRGEPGVDWRTDVETLLGREGRSRVDAYMQKYR
jgi:tRNA dimethylallyltransferase